MSTGMERVRIRHGCSSDRRALVRLLASHLMETDVDPTEFLVAEADGELLGAVRLEWAAADNAFLRPIVVATEAQGVGLGRALLQGFFAVCHKISVVARGDAIPFYRQLGFTTMDWDEVPSKYRHECECCDELPQCRPMSMRWTCH